MSDPNARRAQRAEEPFAQRHTAAADNNQGTGGGAGTGSGNGSSSGSGSTNTGAGAGTGPKLVLAYSNDGGRARYVSPHGITYASGADESGAESSSERSKRERFWRTTRRLAVAGRIPQGPFHP